MIYLRNENNEYYLLAKTYHKERIELAYTGKVTTIF